MVMVMVVVMAMVMVMVIVINSNSNSNSNSNRTSSNQRLGVRSVVPVKVSVCRFTIRERLKFRYDILAKSTIVLWII